MGAETHSPKTKVVFLEIVAKPNHNERFDHRFGANKKNVIKCN